MADTNDRPTHLRALSNDQVALYHEMLREVSAGHGTYWECLRSLEAPAADKYALAEALGNWPAQLEYGPQAGIDPYKGKVDMTTLQQGDQFVGPDERTLYEVTAAADEHGQVEVRNLSISDEEAAERAAADKVTDGRAGFFAYSVPVYVQRVENTDTTETTAETGTDPVPPAHTDTADTGPTERAAEAPVAEVDDADEV